MEQELKYGNQPSTDELAAIFANPQGWERAKYAIFKAAASMVEDHRCTIFTAVNILDTQREGQMTNQIKNSKR